MCKEDKIFFKRHTIFGIIVFTVSLLNIDTSVFYLNDGFIFLFVFQIDHRLNSVGRDLSFMVQPSDFVKHLRKQLKKMHCYEDYLVG